MSDERLRELERQWRTSGSVDDEVALVNERLRTGALDRPSVELAAYLGNPAAKTVLGPSVFNVDGAWAFPMSPDVTELADFRFLVVGLDLWGVPTLVRGLIALARRALPGFQAARPGDQAESYLSAAEAWVVSPGEPTLLAVDIAADAITDSPTRSTIFRVVPCGGSSRCSGPSKNRASSSRWRSGAGATGSGRATPIGGNGSSPWDRRARPPRPCARSSSRSRWLTATRSARGSRVAADRDDFQEVNGAVGSG